MFVAPLVGRHRVFRQAHLVKDQGEGVVGAFVVMLAILGIFVAGRAGL